MSPHGSEDGAFGVRTRRRAARRAPPRPPRLGRGVVHDTGRGRRLPSMGAGGRGRHGDRGGRHQARVPLLAEAVDVEERRARVEHARGDGLVHPLRVRPVAGGRPGRRGVRDRRRREHIQPGHIHVLHGRRRVGDVHVDGHLRPRERRRDARPLRPRGGGELARRAPAVRRPARHRRAGRRGRDGARGVRRRQTQEGRQRTEAPRRCARPCAGST